ncbi:MAG TPA: glycosyl transferase, partial [Ignavibacteriaceae bacterium]
MPAKQMLSRTIITLNDDSGSVNSGNRKLKLLRRIILSGVLSAVLLLIVILTLPKTVLSISSLIEYSMIVALVIFLFILLLRFFGILFL